jgi:hypothetical protein
VRRSQSRGSEDIAGDGESVAQTTTSEMCHVQCYFSPSLPFSGGTGVVLCEPRLSSKFKLFLLFPTSCCKGSQTQAVVSPASSRPFVPKTLACAMVSLPDARHTQRLWEAELIVQVVFGSRTENPWAFLGPTVTEAEPLWRRPTTRRRVLARRSAHQENVMFTYSCIFCIFCLWQAKKANS